MEDYLNSDAQRGYASCQIISALNALVFYGRYRDVGDEEFEELVDLTGCRDGAVIDISPVYQRFGLYSKKISPSVGNMARWQRRGIPVEVDVFRDWAGFHAVTLVGVTNSGFLVANWSRRSPPVEVSQDELELAMPGRGVINRRAETVFLLEDELPTKNKGR